MQLAGGAAPARRWGPRALRSRPDPQHSTGMYDNTKAGTARHHRHRVDARHHGRSRAIWRLSRVGRAKNDFCCAYPNANF